MKTVESSSGVRHLANNNAGITLCGLLRHGRWKQVDDLSRVFIASPASKQCERCEAKISSVLDAIGRVV